MFRLWGYLKKFPNKLIGICAQDPVYEEPLEEFRADFEDQYEYTSEKIDLAFPEPKGKPMATCIFFDSDHTHDTETNIEGLFQEYWLQLGVHQLVGQQAVAASAYSAEFFCNEIGHRGSNYNLVYALLSWNSCE